MELTGGTIITFLVILAIIMLVIILYHVIFIVVDVRKIVGRANDITKEVEGVVMKPLSVMEKSMSWVTDMLLMLYDEAEKKVPKKSKKK